MPERAARGREILPTAKAVGKFFPFPFLHFSALQPYRSRLPSRDINAQAKISKKVSKNRKLDDLKKEIIRLFRTKSKKKMGGRLLL